MANKNKYAFYFKNILRVCSFYCAIFLPLLFFAKFALSFSPFSFNDFTSNPWSYLSASVLSFVFIWLGLVFLNLILPTLIIIFLKLERERSPKKIIHFGDRFRKVGLSAPQIFIMKEPSRLSKFLLSDKLIGFFGLPSPLGAILLLDPRAAQLSEDSLDKYVCPKIIEARYARYSSFLFSFPSFFVSLGFITTGLALYFFKTPSLSFMAFSLTGFTLVVLFAFLFSKSRNDFLEERLKTVFNVDFQCNKALKLIPSFNVNLFHPWYLPGIPLICFSVLFLVLVTSMPIHTFDNFVSMASNRLEQKPLLNTVMIQNTAPTEPNPNISASPVPVASFQAPTISDLSEAIYSGNMRKTIQLIGLGKSIRDRDPAVDGATPLLLALKNGDIEMAYLLLMLGSSLTNEVDNTGKGALFYALESPSRMRTVGYVLSGRIDVNQKSLDGLTAYDYAVKNGWTDVTHMLVKRGVASSNDSTPGKK